MSSEKDGEDVEANRADGGLYMTVEQYFSLDEATDGKYEYLDGYVFMLRPPSSAYDDQPHNMVSFAYPPIPPPI